MILRSNDDAESGKHIGWSGGGIWERMLFRWAFIAEVVMWILLSKFEEVDIDNRLICCVQIAIVVVYWRFLYETATAASGCVLC